MLIKSTEFVTSAVQPSQFPPADLPEFAFAGRSNVGKSSLINTLVNRKKLVLTSSTPGKTRLINFFRVNDALMFVDLPGYGYAKVPQDLQAHWQAFIADYFETRQALRGLVVVMDIRHPLKEYDRQMLGYAVRRGLPAHAILTKADKLGRGAAGNTLQAVRMELSRAFGDSVSVQVFSGEKKTGVDDLRGVVGRWLAL